MRTEEMPSRRNISTARKKARRKAFQRLATKRTTAVLNRIRILGNCANPRLYEYKEKEVIKIFDAIDEELKAVIKPDPFWFGKVDAYEKTGEVFGIRNVKITRYIQEVILDKFFPDDYNG